MKYFGTVFCPFCICVSIEKVQCNALCNKGLFTNDFIIWGAGGCQIMTDDDIGGRGVSQIMTALHKKKFCM